MEDNMRINKISNFLKVYKIVLLVLYIALTSFIIFSLIYQCIKDINLSNNPDAMFVGLGIALAVIYIGIIIGGIGYFILEILFLIGFVLSKKISNTENKNKSFYLYFLIINVVTYVINIGLGLILLEIFKLKTR